MPPLSALLFSDQECQDLVLRVQPSVGHCLFVQQRELRRACGLALVSCLHRYHGKSAHLTGKEGEGVCRKRVGIRYPFSVLEILTNSTGSNPGISRLLNGTPHPREVVRMGHEAQHSLARATRDTQGLPHLTAPQAIPGHILFHRRRDCARLQEHLSWRRSEGPAGVVLRM